jgi:hypothetical protein
MKACTTAALNVKPRYPLLFMAKLLYVLGHRGQHTYLEEVWRKVSAMSRPCLVPPSQLPVLASLDDTRRAKTKAPLRSSLEFRPSIVPKVYENSDNISGADVQPSTDRGVLERSEPIGKYPAFIESAEDIDAYERHKLQGLCSSLTQKGLLCRQRKGRGAELYCYIHRPNPILHRR